MTFVPPAPANGQVGASEQTTWLVNLQGLWNVLEAALAVGETVI